EIINNFTDNEFYFSGNMLGKYPGQPNYKPRSESGISVYNLAMLNVDGNNVFRNLEYGIKAKKSGMSINNKNSFIIDDITSAMNRYTNYGIYMEESNSNVVINDNDFNGNTCSVMCYNGMNNLLDIVENRFVMHSDIEMYIGPRIVVRNNKGGNFSVEKKNIFDVNISSFSFAISFSDNSHHKIHIDDNIFNFKFNSAGTSHVIDFQRNYFDQNYSEDLTSPLVSNNRFNMDRSNSITIYNSPGMVLVNNNFYTNTANPGYGHLIDILNSDDGFFRDNTAHDMTDLFRASSSVNNTFCCNTSNIFGRTFLFTNGGEQFSSLYANKIKTLELKHGSTIGVQPSRGNIWNPQQSSAQITEFEANQTYISKNQFIVDPVQIGHKPLDIYPSLWGSQWFRTTGTSKSCEEYQECNIDNPGGNGGGDADISDDKVNEVAVNYVRTCKHNATGLNPYKELSEWENAMYMYKFQYKYPLIDWESKIDSVQLLEGVNECNGEILQEVIDWYLIQEDIRNIYEMTDSAIIEINNAHQVIRENALEITDWHINNPDPSVVIQPVLYYQNITSAVSRIEGINANLKLSSQARAVNILGRLANLSSRYPFLTELKKVREIEMRIIINGAKNISENEWKDLLRIAKLCPLDYGSVVYEAWGILDSHGLGTDEISIENNCARTIKPRSMQTDITNLNIFPNPSNGNVVIGWGNQEADQILVYDFTGKEIMRSKLVNISEKINLDFSDNN
ncbi:MAG TPA: hypothetical protein PLU49_13910, partial [Saprospiraceae bacterium]|nr:hypothetical protein [Saprospiraceae bacterium]